mmetsp:Transcript_7450/g.19868  ORF Transcript_7450/g.19868 Transcript_7450/m.19868 type:complete len:211 (-) Transcript_7450:57-689(-)
MSAERASASRAAFFSLERPMLSKPSSSSAERTWEGKPFSESMAAAEGPRDSGEPPLKRTAAVSVSRFTAADSTSGRDSSIFFTAAEQPPHFMPPTSSITASDTSCGELLGGARSSVATSAAARTWIQPLLATRWRREGWGVIMCREGCALAVHSPLVLLRGALSANACLHACRLLFVGWPSLHVPSPPRTQYRANAISVYSYLCTALMLL